MSPAPADFDALWNYDDPAATEAAFRALLPGAAEWPADARAQLLSQIARTHSLRRQFADADAALREAEAIAPPAPCVARVRIALERGRTLNSSGSPAAAVPYFLAAWEEARALGADFFAVDAAHMMGIAAPPDERLGWHEKALAAAQASADPRARNWQGSLLNNMGWTYHDAGNHARALELFEQALAFRESQGKPGPIRIAKWSVARTLRSLGRIDEALGRQQELLAEIRSGAAPADGYVFEEMGECLLALGRAEEAAPYFREAHDALSKDEWFAANEPARLARLKELGR